MVMRDIYDLKTGGDNFMMSFSVLLDDTKMLLRDHNQIDWLQSKPSIMQLEDKLPQKEKEEWATKMDTFEGSRFKRFQKFLYSRRMIYERMEVIGTKKTSPKMKDGTEVCTRERCRRKRHDVKDCPAKESPRGTGDRDRLCFKCDQPGHQAKACPTAGRGAGGGHGNGGGSQGQGSNRERGRQSRLTPGRQSLSTLTVPALIDLGSP